MKQKKCGEFSNFLELTQEQREYIMQQDELLTEATMEKRLKCPVSFWDCSNESEPPVRISQKRYVEICNNIRLTKDSVTEQEFALRMAKKLYDDLDFCARTTLCPQDNSVFLVYVHSRNAEDHQNFAVPTREHFWNTISKLAIAPGNK